MFYWFMKTFVLGPVLKLLFRPWVKGLDNVPAQGAAILASNHLSFSDSIFMPVMVPRPVVFLAKSEYFTGTGIKGRLTAAFFRLTNQLPMDRSGGAASAQSLDAGMDVLKSGSLLGIYPEGTRSPDARLYRGKVGVARLALQARVPVIPVAMIGTDKVQPIGKRVPNIRRIGMIFGEPLDFSRYYGMEDDRLIQRSVTDEIMYELMRLSGQEYVDEYAAVVKLRMAGKAQEVGPDAARTQHRTKPRKQAWKKPRTKPRRQARSGQRRAQPLQPRQQPPNRARRRRQGRTARRFRGPPDRLRGGHVTESGLSMTGGAPEPRWDNYP